MGGGFGGSQARTFKSKKTNGNFLAERAKIY